jgi:hypothetical protein
MKYLNVPLQIAPFVFPTKLYRTMRTPQLCQSRRDRSKAQWSFSVDEPMRKVVYWGVNWKRKRRKLIERYGCWKLSSLAVIQGAQQRLVVPENCADGYFPTDYLGYNDNPSTLLGHTVFSAVIDDQSNYL